MTKEELLQSVTEYYLKSNDFNGFSISSLEFLDKQDITSKIRELISDGLIGIIDEDTDVNPYINRRGFEPKDRQIKKVNNLKNQIACIYPTNQHLQSMIVPSEYKDKPYNLCLALGEPQLAYRLFELSVLEYYRNDPRYYYRNDDIQGHIYYDNKDKEQKDRFFLDTFGFSYDSNLNRAVAVFLRYLSNLPSDHQQIWRAKELQGDYKLHPEYYQMSVIGNFPEGAPICDALINEIFIINQMAKVMRRHPFFNKDFGNNGYRPKKFGLLIRSTLEEFNSFIHLLDKMISDNINKKFFLNDISFENEREKKDGRIKIVQKGTLQILDEWIRTQYKTPDWEPWNKAMESLYKVRKLRQKPAHSIDEDAFDQKYFSKQREIIRQAYSALRHIRLVFANNPLVKNAQIEIPRWLQDGKIWTK